MQDPRRIAVMGGTFNPPHVGHLVCALEAIQALGFDRVVLMPANVPPHKSSEHDPGARHRIAMCGLAVADEPGLEVSLLEYDRPGPSYTIDTLDALHAARPGNELTFIVGGDMGAALPTWREPERIVSVARLAIAEREGIRRQMIIDRLAAIPGAVERVTFFEMPRLDISSSLVRERVAAGRTIRYLVPDRVAQYIQREGLYGPPREEASE